MKKSHVLSEMEYIQEVEERKERRKKLCDHIYIYIYLKIKILLK